ncbi:Error-prone DNA polymerase [Phycisphaerae bacterium RAS1]|nr:Error-prone DNA polymerase [Phycisphaerae bacterium RAS1]
MRPEYAELHCLSNFSFLRGASHPEELVEQAALLGYRAIAITDRHSLAGVVRAHIAAREHNQAHPDRPIRLIIGAEVHPQDAPPLVLLAPDRAAYGRLARLLTRGKLRTRKGGCRLFLADVAELAAGMIGIVLTGIEGSRDSGIEGSGDRGIKEDRGRVTSLDPSVPRSLDPFIRRSLDPFSRYRSLFAADDLYLAASLCFDIPDTWRLEMLTDLSQRSGIPLVATNAVHYHAAQRRYLQDVLTCIREKCTIQEAGTRLLANAERRLREREEIGRRYAGCGELLTRSVHLAERCVFSLDELKYEYPAELVPDGRTAIDYLRELTWKGAVERYPDGLPDGVRHLVEKELALIEEVRYEHYFLTVYDLTRYARSRGILCQGRGSAANSAVCYCLGVTAVDPARIDLLFERFISKERNEPPDIDIDFEHERREEVFQYIYEKYGRERAAITAEVISYRPRSAVRDVGKAMGLSLAQVDALAKSLDWWARDAMPEEALRAAGLEPGDRTVQMVIRLVKQLLSFPRHLSQHVGGFVMTESPLCEIVPLENGAMPGRTFIEWNKDDIDALGILKVDCLALGMLTALRKCFRMLEASRDQGIEGSGDQESEGPRGIPDGGLYGEWQGDISRSGCMAQGDRVDETGIPRDATHAGLGTVWPDEPDAASGSVGSEQYCRGQRSADDRRLPAVPQYLPWVAGRAGNSDHHRNRAGDDRRRGGADGVAARGAANASGVDRQPEAPKAAMREGTKRPRDRRTEERGAPRSFLIPRSLDPSIPCSLAAIPPEDPAVYDMICKADTVGVFQIESRAQMSMLPRLRPRNFYDLVIEVAIVRPGPIQGGMVHPYLRRRKGEEPVFYASEAVRQVLAKTLGVPLFQEQVMRLAVVAAGFTPGEADRLRRAMAAWRRSGEIEKFQVKLIKGMLENGYSRQFAEQIYRQIQGFGEYGFPESHAASFALLVYASAWLKRYHPAAFCGAVINSQPMGFYTPGQLIRDAIAHGVRVLPVDVNASEWNCVLKGQGTGNREQGTESDSRSAGSCSLFPVPCSLRLGFRLVRGLSETKMRGIVEARSAGAVLSIRQLARREDVSRDTLVRLAAADAFGSLGLSRRAALWQILALDDADQPLLADLEPAEQSPPLPTITMEETVVQDYGATGLSLNAHPIELVRPELDRLRVSPNGMLKTARNRQKISVAGLVTCRQHPSTAKGIVFITLEDESDNANLIVRPQVWERYKSIARQKLALIADGVVERQGDVVHVLVQRIRDLSALLGGLRHASRDFC